MSPHRINKNLVLPVALIIVDCFNPAFCSAAARSLSFVASTDVDGFAYCQTITPPTAVIAVGEIVGLPDGVPDPVRCGFFCTGFANCTGYNYKTILSVNNDWTSICELFDYSSCDRSTLQKTSGCTYYLVCTSELPIITYWQ
jgi:hypothetical protein